MHGQRGPQTPCIGPKRYAFKYFFIRSSFPLCNFLLYWGTQRGSFGDLPTYLTELSEDLAGQAVVGPTCAAFYKWGGERI